MEKGGSVQQANRAFCLCLCRGVRGLFSRALEQQQQLVQREMKTEGGGGDGGEEKDRRSAGEQYDMALNLYSMSMFWAFSIAICFEWEIVM